MCNFFLVPKLKINLKDMRTKNYIKRDMTPYQKKKKFRDAYWNKLNAKETILKRMFYSLFIFLLFITTLVPILFKRSLDIHTYGENRSTK